jgi:single-strand DNA-binding protein
MAAVNKVILIGNLGKDPELKQFEGDNLVANVTLATTESYKDKQGNKVENTEWHDLEIWGQQARIAEQYLKKGSQLYVEGKIKTEKWEKDGQKHSRVKIRVTSFTMLGSKRGDQTEDSRQYYQPNGNNGAAHASISQEPQSSPPMDGPDNYEDTLPF